jgi:hypothetical protein
MDNKKFEQLIDLIINENEEQAKALFHDIVVEKSREIYESMMDEEGMEEGMGGQVGDLLDEIGAEEQGMTEEEDDLEFGDDGDDEVIDLDMDDEEEGEEGLEDRVVDLEDKLDQLMAEFEEIMGGDDMGDDDMDDMEGDDMDDMEGDDMGDEEDQAMMEAIALKNVPGLYGSKIGGDNGVQTKSTSLANSGQAGMDSRPVKFSGDNEPVPTSPKSPSNYGTKGETQVKGAGSFKNAPAQAKQSLEKAPAPTKTQASGVNTKSPVAESRNSTKRRV